MGKQARQRAIARLVRRGVATRQADIIRALKKRGHRVDQSTLSRDLAELGIRKRGGRYALESNGDAAQEAPDFSAAVVSYTVCGPHLILVRTGIGQANAIAVYIESQECPSIAGTLAGDDTIFVATKTRRAQTVALRRLAQWFGEKHER